MIDDLIAALENQRVLAAARMRAAEDAYERGLWRGYYDAADVHIEIARKLRRETEWDARKTEYDAMQVADLAEVAS